jgi:hypothetical protein
MYIYITQKLKNMTYKIFISDDRIKFLVNELGESKVKVLDKKDTSTTPVEVTIESASDLLNVFHAGIMAGIKVHHQ